MDVARYFRQQSDGGVREGLKKRNATHLDVEPDGDVPENKAYRYWSGESMALELRRDFRRIRIRPLSPTATTTIINRQKLDTFILLESKDIIKVNCNLLYRVIYLENHPPLKCFEQCANCHNIILFWLCCSLDEDRSTY